MSKRLTSEQLSEVLVGLERNYRYYKLQPGGAEKNVARIMSLAIQAVQEVQERRQADSEPVEWQFKSANGDWISVGQFGKEEAVREGCEVRALYAEPQPLNNAERAELEQYRNNYQWREQLNENE